jgi:hypothetical protein
VIGYKNLHKHLFPVLIMKSVSLVPLVSFLVRKSGILIFSFFCVLILCEIYFRLPFLPQRLEYQVDDELIAVLRPNQVGFQWQGNMSYKSPLIKINSEGFRGEEIEWSKPIIAAFGNSEAFGSGVRDNEVWTSILQKKFNSRQNGKNLNIVNASHPGHGPYKHYVRIKRVLDSHNINGIILRVDIADRYFRYIPTEKKYKLLKKASIRQKIRVYTKALPYIYNKMTAQLPSIKNSFKPIFIRTNRTHSITRQAGRMMWNENKKWWRKIIKLTSNKRIAIVFMIVDPYNSEGNSELEAGLKEVSEEYKNVYVLRLGPKNFGLSGKTREQLDQEISKKLTLGRDPHANPLQHKLIAVGLYGCIQKMFNQS